MPFIISRRVEPLKTPRLSAAPAALLALIFAAIAPAPAHSATCYFQWTRTYYAAGVADNLVDERVLGIAHDALGNPIVVGYTDATKDLMGTNWMIKKYSAVNGSELGCTIYNYSLNPVKSEDKATSIAVDPSGSFYVAGYIDRSDEGTDKDWMLRKYDTMGALIWSRTHSCELNGVPPQSDDDRALGVAVDPSGNVIAVGFETAIWADRRNILVRKYSSDGFLFWSASHGGSEGFNDEANAVATDSVGNIIVVGGETIGPAFDAIIIKYAPAGGPLWKDVWGAVGDPADVLMGVGVDSSGSIFAAGYTRDSSDNGLLMKYAPNGIRIWLDTYPGPAGGDDRFSALAQGPDGTFAAGGYTTRADLGQGKDWFFGKYDSDGNQVWSNTYNSPGNADDEVCALAYDSATRLTVGGFETRTDRAQGEDWRVFRYPPVFPCPDAWLTPSKNQLVPGEAFTVTLSVKNAGEGGFYVIKPFLHTVAGPASAIPVGGPVPPVVSSLAGYATANFVWTWRAIAPGYVSFSATATGGSTIYLQASSGVTVVATPPAPQISADTMGRDFWLAFMLDGAGTPDEYSVVVAGAPGTLVKAEMPWIPLSVTASIDPSGMARLQIDDTAGISTIGGIENLGVHVTSSADIAAYAFDCHACITDAWGTWSSDGTLVLPTAVWGCEYLVQGYGRTGTPHTQFAVVAGANGTNVTITPPAGAPVSFMLNQGNAYRLAGALDDLAGSIVTADQPVAVFGGAEKTEVPEAVISDGSHLFEAMLPTKYWGTRFVAAPVAGREYGDTFTFISASNGTGISVNGAAPFTLDRGKTREMLVTGPAEITADKPIQVVQYLNSHSYDLKPGDPAMMLVPAVDQFVSDALVPGTSSTLFTADYLNIAVPSGSAGSMIIDGAAVSATCFSPAGSSGYSAGAVLVAPGRHHVTGAAPFGLQAYGFFQSGANSDAYAWSGPLSLSPRSRLTLSGPASVERWQTFDFTISWVNREVHTADFLIWDTIPAGTTLVSASNGGTLYGGTVAWTVNDVPPGWTGQVTYTLKVPTSISTMNQQVSAEYATTAAACPISLSSNALTVPVVAPSPAPVKVYPNPFYPGKAVNGTIKFRGIKNGGKLHVFTISGRLVWEAVAGVDPVEWDGKNSGGEKVVPGVYLWTAEGEQGKERGKIFLKR